MSVDDFFILTVSLFSLFSLALFWDMVSQYITGTTYVDQDDFDFEFTDTFLTLAVGCLD